MKIKFYLDTYEVLAFNMLGTNFFNNEVKISVDGLENTYKILEHKEVIRDGGWSADHEITLVRAEPIKSKEEIAAEESVAKAKDALKAAEDVLKRVKEKQ